jgi:hypothetical protein
MLSGLHWQWRGRNRAAGSTSNDAFDCGTSAGRQSRWFSWAGGFAVCVTVKWVGHCQFRRKFLDQWAANQAAYFFWKRADID